MRFDELLALSTFPIVDLREPTPPTASFMISAPSECVRNFGKDDLCRKHYKLLSEGTSSGPFPCPFGFASFAVRQFNVAFSGVIVYPRLGGDLERMRAKKYPDNRVQATAF